MATELLPCKLTDDEVLDRTSHLLDALTAEDRLEAEKKRFAEEHKEASAVVNAKVSEYRRIVSTRTEHREIEVAESHDYKRGVVEMIRTDTHEIVRTRAMSEKERQSPLFEAETKHSRA